MFLYSTEPFLSIHFILSIYSISPFPSCSPMQICHWRSWPSLLTFLTLLIRITLPCLLFSSPSDEVPSRRWRMLVCAFFQFPRTHTRGKVRQAKARQAKATKPLLSRAIGEKRKAAPRMMRLNLCVCSVHAAWHEREKEQQYWLRVSLNWGEKPLPVSLIHLNAIWREPGSLIALKTVNTSACRRDWRSR